MFGLFRAWKRRRLAKRPFPDTWLPYIEQHVAFYPFLPPDLRERFLELLKVFVWEKHFIGAGGMEITDEVKVVISAAAVRMVLHLDLGYYNRLTEIIVYPSHYHHADDDGGGVILGEAHTWGTVVLSWDAVIHGLKYHSDGHDTATHEFAHVLDRGGGSFDGTPVLRETGDYRPWAEVMTHHYTNLVEGKANQRKVMRNYGATNEAEFFAVATESFFEKPEQMSDRTPDLYELLKAFYGCDPLARRHEARTSGRVKGGHRARPATEQQRRKRRKRKRKRRSKRS